MHTENHYYVICRLVEYKEKPIKAGDQCKRRREYLERQKRYKQILFDSVFLVNKFFLLPYELILFFSLIIFLTVRGLMRRITPVNWLLVI